MESPRKRGTMNNSMANFSLSDNALVNYVRSSREELSKVVWPSRSKIVKHTAIVIALSVGVGVFFGIEMHRRSKVPQGLISTAHGGTSSSATTISCATLRPNSAV